MARGVGWCPPLRGAPDEACRKRDFPVEQIRRLCNAAGRTRQLGASRCTQRHDLGLAHGDGLLPFTGRLHDFRGQPQRRVDPPQQGLRDQLPTEELLDAVVGIGNCSGAQVDKFERFGLRTRPGTQVSAPLIDACRASLGRQLHDGRQIRRHNLFIWEVVKAHVAPNPRTLHDQSDGQFMVAGAQRTRRRLFKPEML
jgi:hypothetical protein